MRWVVEGGGSVNAGRVEQDEVGFGAVADDAAVGQSETLSGRAGHLADGLFQREQPLTSHELGQHVGIGAKRARIGPAAGEDGVGPNHLGRVGGDFADVFEVAGPGDEGHLKVFLQQQVADGIDHTSAAVGRQFLQRPTLPLLVLVRGDVGKDVIVEGLAAPLGLDGANHHVAHVGVGQPGHQRLGAAGVYPVWQ